MKKRFLSWRVGVAAALLLAAALGAQTFATKVRFTNGGNALVVASGGTLQVDSGSTFTVNSPPIRTAQEFQVGFGSAKAGATAGWVVAGATNLAEWTLPASQSASTLVIPINGLHVGDTITGFKIECQIESAGGAVTLDADLRSLTNVAADPTDASVGAITQVAVTADTASQAAKTGLSDVVAATERFYILMTGTTAASTDVRCLGATVTVTTG